MKNVDIFELTNANSEFYDGLYIDFIYRNMYANEKICTGSGRATLVVFKGVGGLEVKYSVRNKTVPIHFSKSTVSGFLWGLLLTTETPQNAGKALLSLPTGGSSMQQTKLLQEARFQESTVAKLFCAFGV